MLSRGLLLVVTMDWKHILYLLYTDSLTATNILKILFSLVSLFSTTTVLRSQCHFEMLKWAASSSSVSSFVMIVCQILNIMWTLLTLRLTFNDIKWLLKPLVSWGCLLKTTSSISHNKLCRDWITSDFSVPVNKGEQLTTTYTNTLRTTLERRRHLKQTKIFDCDCNRCCDSSELSTHGSAWICSSCGGLVESKNPLKNDSMWECNGCKLQFSVEVSIVERVSGKAIFHMNFIRSEKIAFPFSISTIWRFPFNHFFHLFSPLGTGNLIKTKSFTVKHWGSRKKSTEYREFHFVAIEARSRESFLGIGVEVYAVFDVWKYSGVSIQRLSHVSSVLSYETTSDIFLSIL